MALGGADDLAPPAATPTKTKGAGREVGKNDSPGTGASAGVGDSGLPVTAAAPELEPAAVTVTEPEAGSAAAPEILVVAAATVPDLQVVFPVAQGAMGASRIMVVTKLGLRATAQFDARVAALVSERQAAAGLPVTGIVDEATFNVL